MNDKKVGEILEKVAKNGCKGKSKNINRRVIIQALSQLKALDKCPHLSMSQTSAQPGYETLFCSKCGKTAEEINSLKPKIDEGKLVKFLEDNINEHLSLDGYSQGNGYKDLAHAISQKAEEWIKCYKQY